MNVVKAKLICCNISMLKPSTPTSHGSPARCTESPVPPKQGIDSRNAKKITKLIRSKGSKAVKTQMQGYEICVNSKRRDDLQVVIAMLNNADRDVAPQFVHYRTTGRT